MKRQALLILPLVLLAAITGIWAGWFRIGWTSHTLAVSGEHGAIMVGCFLGTLISLERAAALKNKYIFLIPVLSGSSLLVFLLGFRIEAYLLLIMGSIGYAGMMAHVLWRFSETHFLLLFAGAVCWLIGNLMLVFWQMYPVAVSWWIAFLLLTITAEMLELSRFLPFTLLKRNLLYLALGIYAISLLMPFHGNGRYLSGIGLVCIALWLLHYDMARKAIKKEGIHRYSGILLLTGFIWLLASGLFMLWDDVYGPLYDTALHAFFIGFVFSMIFAHGPAILPAVLGFSVKPYHPILYMWFVLLQGSLSLRITANFLSAFELRKWAGLLNGIAILAFFVNMAILMLIELYKVKNRAERQKIKISHPFYKESSAK